MLIYRAIFSNNKSYIGLTNNLKHRIVEHKYYYIKDKRNNKFYNAIKKYGFDNLKWKILENDIKNRKIASKKERHYIKKYDTYNNGYNSTTGGENEFIRKSIKHSKKSKKIISKKLKIWCKNNLEKRKGKNNPNYGNKWTQEQKDKASKKLKKIMKYHKRIWTKTEKLYFSKTLIKKYNKNPMLHYIKWIYYIGYDNGKIENTEGTTLGRYCKEKYNTTGIKLIPNCIIAVLKGKTLYHKNIIKVKRILYNKSEK